MSVDPKISAWINIIIALLGATGALSGDLTNIFGSGTAQHIVTVAGAAAAVLGTVNTALHGLSSAQAGPIASGPNA